MSVPLHWGIQQLGISTDQKWFVFCSTFS